MALTHGIELLGQNSEGLFPVNTIKTSVFASPSRDPGDNYKGFESLKASPTFLKQEPLSVQFITVATRDLGFI